MCMITDKTEYLVVPDKPVTCYKAMRPIDYGSAVKASDYKFRSEYMGYIYTLGEDYSLRGSADFPEANLDGLRMRVDEGFHSYARLEDAYCYCVYENMSNQRLGIKPLVLVECEIPAGARYWVGDEGGYSGYCSDRIRILAWKPWHGKDWVKAVPPAGAV